MQRLHVGVGGDELDAFHAGRDHAVDGVVAAAADADDLDRRRLRRFVLILNAEIVHLAHRLLLPYRFFGSRFAVAACALRFARSRIKSSKSHLRIANLEAPMPVPG